MLALAFGLLQSVVPLIGARRRDAVLMRLADSTARMQCAFIWIAFLALVLCYVSSDFSLRTVYENSHSLMPLVYKVTSVWGNHGAELQRAGRHIRRAYRRRCRRLAGALEAQLCHARHDDQ